jgi:predicted PurR-regulated permease PerM
VLTCGAAVLAVLAILWYLRVIVWPVLLALTIAPALSPVARVLRRRLGRPAAAVALVLGLAVIGGLIAIVAVSVLAQYDELADAVTQAADDIRDWLEGEPFNLTLDRVDELQSSLAGSWRQVSGYLVSSVQAGAGLFAGIVLAVAVLYFVLRDGTAFWNWILRRLTPETRPAVERAGQRAWAVLGGFVAGTAFIAAVDAALIGISLWLLGVPLAFALAVLVFLGAFVPFIGAFISGLVAVLVAFADRGWQIGLVVLGVVVAVQFVEGNFLQPIIQSRTVDLHPAVILLAVVAGASLFGILGAYLAVPITAVVFAVVVSLRSDLTAPVPDDPGSQSPGSSPTL